MAKQKIAIDIKLDMLAEVNKKELDRLLSKPFNLKQKDFLYTAKKTVEVVDPEWTPKIFQQNLFYSVRRQMQTLAVRAGDALKAFDKESNSSKQEALVVKLRKKLDKSAKTISSQASSDLKKIIDAATKDAPKWEKVREVKDEMDEIDGGANDLNDAVDKLEEKLNRVIKKIGKFEFKEKAEIEKAEARTKKRLVSNKKGRTDGSTDNEFQIKLEHTDAIEKIKKDLKKDRKDLGKLAEQGFNTYKSDRKSFDGVLKKTIKITRKIQSKDEEDENVKKLKVIFKKMSKEAGSYGDYLDGCDKKIDGLMPKFKSNEVTPSDVQLVLPKPSKGRALFSQVEAARQHMKKSKMKK